MEPKPTKVEALHKEISDRLRPVCQGWPDELFAQLVKSIAAITIKYDDALDRFDYDPSMTDSMIADMRDLADKSAKIRKTDAH